MCLDVEPLQEWSKGLYLLDTKTNTTAYAKAGDQGPYYRPHWGTCPDAHNFRRKGTP
jgi:hypothetical protein